MKQSNSYLPLIFLLLAAFPAKAQEVNDAESAPLSRELVLEKEFIPMVRDASKINLLPEVSLPTIPKSTIRYSDRVEPYTYPRSLQILPAASYAQEQSYSQERFFADFALGNYWNMRGTIGGQLLQSKHDELTLWAQHHSSAGKVRYTDLENQTRKPFLKQLSEFIAVDYKHHFQPLTLSVAGDYRYRLFNYYGSNLLTQAQDAALPTDQLPQYASNQEQQQFNVRLGINSNEASQSPLRYQASFNYQRFANRLGYFYGVKGAVENHLRTDFSLAGNLAENSQIALAVRMDNLLYDRTPFDNYTRLQLNPYYTAQSEGFDLHVGIRADLTFNQGTALRFAPDVCATWEFAPYFFLIGKIEGGKELNTFSALADQTWYNNPSYRPVDSYRPMDAQIAFRTNYFKSWAFNLYAGYDIVRDNAIETLQMTGTVDPGFGLYSLTRSALTYESMHTSNFYWGASAQYRYREIVSVEMNLKHNQWENRGENPYPVLNRPQWEGIFSVAVSPIRQLTISADYTLQTGREAWVSNDVKGAISGIDPETAILKMKDINAINLRATYAFTSWLSANLAVNNLLGEHYLLYWGMPVQGFNFMAGVACKF